MSITPLITFVLFLLFGAISAAKIKSADYNPTTFHFKLGHIRGFIVSDGPAAFPQSPFLTHDDTVRRSFQFFSQPTFPFQFGVNVVVLDTPHGRLMIDAGSRGVDEFPFFQGHLLQNLHKAGIETKSIDAILLTHAHFDHVGALTDGNGNRTFPNAKVYVNRDEHLFFTSKKRVKDLSAFADTVLNVSRKVYQDRIGSYMKANDVVLVNNFESPIRGIRFIPAPGHTDHHSMIEVKVGRRRLLVVGDTWFSRASQVQNPDWALAPETNQTQAYFSRVSVMDNAVKNRDLLAVYHESFPGLGYVVRKGPWFDWFDVSKRFDATSHGWH